MPLDSRTCWTAAPTPLEAAGSFTQPALRSGLGQSAGLTRGPEACGQVGSASHTMFPVVGSSCAASGLLRWLSWHISSPLLSLGRERCRWQGVLGEVLTACVRQTFPARSQDGLCSEDDVALRAPGRSAVGKGKSPACSSLAVHEGPWVDSVGLVGGHCRGFLPPKALGSQ